MKVLKYYGRKAVLPIMALAFAAAVWELLVHVLGIPMYVLPPPSRVLSAFWRELHTLLIHGLVTFEETLIGIFLALILGVFLSVLMDAMPKLKSAVYPILVISQTIPVIVLAPIFIIYMGFGIMPKIVTVVLMCFFPIAVSFSDGLARVDMRLINLVKALGAKKQQIYRIVKIPAAASALFSGLKVAATYSISGAVVGEWLSSNSGLGYYMLKVKNAYMMDKLFASVLMVVILSLVMNAIVRALRMLLIPADRGNQNK